MSNKLDNSDVNTTISTDNSINTPSLSEINHDCNDTQLDIDRMKSFRKRELLERLKSHMTEDEAWTVIEQQDRVIKPKRSVKTRVSNYLKNSFKADVIKFIKSIGQGFFPDDCTCIICGIEIPRGSKYGLCDKHMSRLPLNDGKICVRCGKPTENEAIYCNECQNHHRYFDVARGSLEYTGDATRIVAWLKFHNCKWLAKYMAEMMADTYITNVFDADIIVPAPLSSERMAERGYNQSLEIAKCLSEILSIPIARDTVIKHKNIARQSELSGRERHANVKGAYSLGNRKIVKGKKVVIIDDILTTGSTASEIARQLKIAGATDVYVLVFASARYKITGENLSDYEVIDNLDM